MIDPAAGVLLISDPFLKDPNFLRTVVLICENDEDGTFGLVVNRQYKNTLDEIFPELEGFKIPVYYGGPVQLDVMHFLHQYPDKIPGSIKLLNGVYWGGNFEVISALLRSGEIDADGIRFIIGYSGWSGGQLDEEMKEKSWLTVEATRNIIFHKDIKEIWKEALRHLGGEYEMMINFPIDPQMN